MSYWEIVVPSVSADYTNLCTNPSLESATTGWGSINSATVSRGIQYSRRGYYGAVVEVTAATADGVYYGDIALTSGTTYQMSFDAYGITSIPYTAYFATTADAQVGTATDFTGNSDYQRINVSYSATATANYRCIIRKNDSASVTAWGVDGLLVVAATAEVTYFDGDSDGCYWTGTAHASTSVAPKTERKYGSFNDLDDYGFYVVEIGGAGMPQLANYYANYAQKPGAFFQGQKVLPRQLLLVGDTVGTSRTDLHDKRKQLINVIKPDLQKNNQNFVLAYTGSSTDKRVLIEARYDDGLQLGALDGFSERIAIALTCEDPYWYEDGEGYSTGATRTTSASADYLWAKIDGTWSDLGAALDGRVTDVEKHPVTGDIYICGAFTTAGGNTNCNYIAYYDGSSWNDLDQGLNGIADHMEFDSSGNLYVCGVFTTAGASADTVNYIAKWNGTQWSSLDGGVGAGVNDFSIAPNGDLYAVGLFTTVGASADTANRIAKWDGTSWSALGTGLNGSGYGVEVARNGDVYVSGAFTTANGVSCTRIAYWNGTTFVAMGSGLDNYAENLVFDDIGNLYLGGSFTTAGGVSANYVAKWNGQSYSALGAGLNNAPIDLHLNNGILYASGNFTSAGSISVDYFAGWNGSSWIHIPAEPPTAVTAGYCLRIIDGDDVYLGYNNTGTAYGSNTVTLTNTGTASAYPVIKIKYTSTTSAPFKYLKNQNTGDTLWFDYTILPQETLTLDFENRTITSDYFGNVIGRCLLRGSDFSKFKLLPGDNTLEFFVNGSNATPIITWKIKHWSADGVA